MRNTRQPTLIRVCIYANTRIQCMRVLPHSYVWTNLLFLLLLTGHCFLPQSKREFSLFWVCVYSIRAYVFRLDLGKMLAETVETNILQLITLTEKLIKREIIFAIQSKIYCFLSNGTGDTCFKPIFMQQTQPKDNIFSTQVNTVQASHL